MTLHKTRLGTNEDGSPLYHYHEDDPTKAVVFVGPNITGTVEVEGQTVDVTDLFVSVPAGQELALSDAIGQRFVDEGHPAHKGDAPFVHTPSALTHNPDGTVSEAFQAAVEAQAESGKDSSPLGVITALESTTSTPTPTSTSTPEV